MSYYFLEKDYRKLVDEMQSIEARIKDIGKEMGASCQEGAETFHDNFAYEDGERQQYMWSKRLSELRAIRNMARVVHPESEPERVALGRLVSVLDEDTDEITTYRIGSYMTFDGNRTISYSAPLARLLIGAEKGDVRSGIVSGKKRSFLVVDIR